MFHLKASRQTSEDNFCIITLQHMDDTDHNWVQNADQDQGPSQCVSGMRGKYLSKEQRPGW